MEAPQTSHAPGKPSWWTTALLVVVMLVAGGYALTYLVGHAGSRGIPWPRAATYTVRVSPGNTAVVVYGGVSDRGTNTQVVDSTWTQTGDVSSGIVQLMASSLGNGTVDCTLTIDGFKTITGHGSGPGGVAICSATFK